MKYNCPEHGKTLIISDSQDFYICSDGCNYPVLNNIPRFVADEEYASSFGLQWNKFRTTQLDSCNGLAISKDRLERIAGGSLDVFKDKRVLEAGCGAGRFTEIMLKAGANVFAVDISNAVEANYLNCKMYTDYNVCQSDIRKMPFLPEQFDIVVCIGVIQHTPDPEETMKRLCLYVKPGGILLIDHYTYGYPETYTRMKLRKYMLKKSPGFSMICIQLIVTILWPFHLLLWKLRNISIINKIRNRFIGLSPVVDYHDYYPQLNNKLMYSWAVLDTHDTLTDRYKHLRSTIEIKNHLEVCGMTEINAVYGGNGVEALARKPVVK